MAVLTLEPALPGERKRSQGGPLEVVLCLLVIAMITLTGLLAHRNRVMMTIPLHAITVAVGPGGNLVEVTATDQLVPGSRVLAGMPDSDDLAREQAAWLADGTVPRVPGLDSDMISAALLDLHVLSQPYGVAVAGWSEPWRYVWPRDAALVASALAHTGHLADAERILGFLQHVQPESGFFEARYLPDGSGVPNDRGIELDGIGWALWVVDQVAAELNYADRTAFLERHRQLIDRSTQAALRSISTSSALPLPSADYWEVKERRLTLATAAVVCAGLGSSARLYGMLGDVEQRAAAEAAAKRLRAAIKKDFGHNGYPRYLGGRSDTVDLGVDFLLPPLTSDIDQTVVRAWGRAATVMARPAGGLAPGGSWRRDGVSWTNATASRAVTAASIGDHGEALARLRWLDQHRTAAGSLPEKVLADGQPAAVAPLAWTAAAVVITADQLSS
jgi:glucoamylase